MRIDFLQDIRSLKALRALICKDSIFSGSVFRRWLVESLSWALPLPKSATGGVEVPLVLSKLLHMERAVAWDDLGQMSNDFVRTNLGTSFTQV